MDNVLIKHYEGKGVRWFIRRGSSTVWNKGFRTKSDASRWIDENPDFDWRAGYIFRFVGDNFDRSIVNRKGVLAKI